MAQVSGDKLFSENLKKFFSAEAGAYSAVTETEANDGQVTLTGHEKALAIGYFGADSLAPMRGNDAQLGALGLDARRNFHLVPDGRIVSPKLKYAKAEGSELRLYFNNDDFKVSAGHFWGIFIRDGKIWLCSFSPWFLEDLNNGAPDFDRNPPHALEDEEDGFQMLANKGQTESVVMRWSRNPAVANKAIADSGYRCELFPDIGLFTSRASGKPYLEAHHFIPMKAQSVFGSVNLDQKSNICVLSPFAHRKIHHAPFAEIRDDIRKLSGSRGELLEKLGVGIDYVDEIYGGSG